MGILVRTTKCEAIDEGNDKDSNGTTVTKNITYFNDKSTREK